MTALYAYPRRMLRPLRRRETLDTFEPYSWEPSSEEIARSVGLPTKKILRLDLNTSPVAPLFALRRLERSLRSLRVNEYPDTSYRELRAGIAGYTGHEVDGIVPTNGADEGIDIVARVFLEKGMKALASVPTYSYFRIATQLQGAEFVGVKRLPNFQDDIEAILSSIDSKVGVIFLCSPNNPTGNVTDLASIERICSETDACVVVDEAYFEYSGVSAQPLTKNYDNLVIVRTLSKAFGLAGARTGYLLAGIETTRLLNKARPPNSLGVINIRLAIYALRHSSYVGRLVGMVARERERVAAGLRKLGLEPFPSSANFLLTRFRDIDADRVYRELLRRGIVVRNLAKSPLTPNCLRITIGLKEQNDLFLNALDETLDVIGR